MKYRKKPVVIEAVKVCEIEPHKCLHFCEGKAIMQINEETFEQRIAIETLEGTMIANKGDYIIKGIKGEFYPCKPDIFEASYEAVNDPQ
jgi:hypothetical protein